MARPGVRPIGAVLVILGSGTVVRRLDQQLVMPEPQRYAGELGGDSCQASVEGELPQGLIGLPQLQDLLERLVIFPVVGRPGLVRLPRGLAVYGHLLR